MRDALEDGAPTFEEQATDGDRRRDAWLTRLHTLPGIGPRRLAALAELLPVSRPIPTCFDLVSILPEKLVDRAIFTEVRFAPMNKPALFVVRIEAHSLSPSFKQPQIVRTTCGTTPLDVVLFRTPRPRVERDLPIGATRLLGGKLSEHKGQPRLVQPDMLTEVPAALPERLIEVVYPSDKALASSVLKRLIEAALSDLPELDDWLDTGWRDRQFWPPMRAALQQLHTPTRAHDLKPEAPARERLAYDELLAQQLALGKLRAANISAGAAHLAPSRLRQDLLDALPFTLTGDQRRAVEAISADAQQGVPMRRLLQGDVGSGKTLVALCAMLDAFAAEQQAVLVAPTEVLARQHAASLTGFLKPLGLDVALLTGKDPQRLKRPVVQGLADGSIRLAVGTHALFQQGIEMNRLGFAVIDEQHRFGINQRLALIHKGQAPHVLLMTATPIPRSLVMAQYGDVARSDLREKPPGRQPITTAALSIQRLDELLNALDKLLQRGEQFYWVCPLIAESGALDLTAAEARHAHLLERFGVERVGLLHGRLKAGDKQAVLGRFAAGATGILVATTVIEVGIDVPNATGIVIEDAQRFGLAQLHQLRGRVGRGSKPSQCVLLYRPPLGKIARARLDTLRRSNDGFAIAEADLRLRGPGEVLGLRQSGLPRYRFADLAAHETLQLEAASHARRVLSLDPDLNAPEHRLLRCLLRLYGYTQENDARLQAG